MQDQAYEELSIIKPVEKPLPLLDTRRKAEAKGTIAADDLKIFIPEDILKLIIGYSQEEMGCERGGVLAGRLYSYNRVEYIEIEGFIRANHTVATSASLRFTHDTWADIHKELDARFKESIIVGWQHTHPGYGIFLSNTDLFTHKNFFNLPWMVALVVDPKSQQLGFFQWKAREVVPCGFYFIR